uniref:Uncharacterized protein n=1 Tax=Romanomermis culicivorax TaxID=13658 RepID=A0A915ITB4_ROMCU
MPDYTGVQVVSPTICRKNPIQCLPDACSKMQKNYRKDCDDGVFREQLLASLRK